MRLVAIAPRPVTPDWLPLLLQTGDALFPTGAYAHSLGFEEAVRLGLAWDEASLRGFLQGRIVPGLTAFELPFLRFARQAALEEDFGLLAELDTQVDASKLAKETREGSAQLGRRRLQSLRVILPDHPLLTECDRRVRCGKLAAHHVIVCGVQAVALGLPLEIALGTYFYQNIAAVGGAALKLMRIGQEGVQRAVRAVACDAPEVIARSLTVEPEDAGWFDPLLEIASMRHERAGERLFIS